MVIDSIAFIGDSFTWGEGLEFYQNTPKWISQRKKPSSWMEYKDIIEPADNVFREQNRWAGIVSEYFKSHMIIDDRNGGAFISFAQVLDSIMQANNDYPNNHPWGAIRNPKVVITQFSNFNRNAVHWHLDADRYKCYCDLCFPYSDKSPENKNHLFITFGHICNVFWDADKNSKEYNHIKNWISKNFKKTFDDKFFYTDEIERFYVPLHLEHYIKKYMFSLHNRNTQDFFIDSWDELSSKILFENKYITDRLIPLIGYDDNLYLKWSEWESTFPYKRISDEFKGCYNGHPTLLQNQYLAKSVINHLEKNYNTEIKEKRFI